MDDYWSDGWHVFVLSYGRSISLPLCLSIVFASCQSVLFQLSSRSVKWSQHPGHCQATPHVEGCQPTPKTNSTSHLPYPISACAILPVSLPFTSSNHPCDQRDASALQLFKFCFSVMQDPYHPSPSQLSILKYCRGSRGSLHIDRRC